MLAACGARLTGTPGADNSAPVSGSPPTGEPTATSQPLPLGSAGKLTVIHRTEFFEGVQIRFRDLATQFAQDNRVTLDISTANPERFGNFNAKMQAAVEAGNPPDVAYHTLPMTQLYALDLVEDVSELVVDVVNKYGAVVPVTAERNARFDGKWWAVPFMSTTGAWFGRSDLFEAAGIDLATLDTFDKRREAALRVSDPGREIWGWGLTLNTSGDGHQLIIDVIQAFGGSFTDPSGHKVVFNSPQTVEAVHWLQETYTSDRYRPMLPPGIEGWTDPSNNEAYLAGKIALTANGFSLYAKARMDNNPLYRKTAILRKPRASNGALLESGVNGWFTIFKGAKNSAMARRFIHYMLEPANFTPMVRDGGGMFLPAYTDLWTDALQALDPNFATLKEIIFNPTPYSGIAYPADPNVAIDNVIAVAIPSQMMAKVTSGALSPEQAVLEAHDRIVQIFEEAGLPQG